MVILAGYAKPDFSGYYRATGSIGFILILGEYTILQQFVMVPVPKHAIGLVGIALLLHGLYGLREDKKIQRNRSQRLDKTIDQYNEETGSESGFADLGRGDDEFQENNNNNVSEAVQKSDQEQESEQ